ncbi:hypothetical protein HANVADRAFT_24201 [Hanseniaspora valbyensis NRRL Y-1626]|uniref:Glutamate/phenylalanine/leucine/valine/L-tryptophan dehydrogenase C-terminal domain-containing protein n=1 Tax=Hanseniaspora valbyensis NRRL Y-1626 TaxID=766949 RepID=A0A1B7TDU8_9ASCO|nr:hypothetical protein HANVADRAFT_24201 [Hanseniaspora valbyensis NRRL Y-1626]
MTGAAGIPDIATLSISSSKDYSSTTNNNIISVSTDDIIDTLDSQGIIPETLIERELSFFINIFNSESDFKKFTSYFNSDIALLTKIISLLYLKKIELGLKSDDDVLDIKEVLTGDKITVLLTTSSKGFADIDSKFLDSNEHEQFHLEAFQTSLNNLSIVVISESEQDLAKNSDKHDQFHLEAFQTSLNNLSIVVISESEQDLAKSDSNLKIVDKIRIAAADVKKQSGPYLQFVSSSEHKDNEEFRLIISFKKGTTTNFYQLFNQLLDYYKIKTHKVHLETYSEGLLLFSFYFTQSDNESKTNLETTLSQILKETSLIYCLPIVQDIVGSSSTSSDDSNFVLSPQEKSYFKIASCFVYHFIDRLAFHNNGADLITYSTPQVSDVLTTYQQILKQQSFSEQLIANVLFKYKKLVVKLFKTFALTHYPKELQTESILKQTLSYQRILTGIEPFHSDEEFDEFLKANVDDQSPDYLILQSLKTFNDSILKTNFFMNEKLAISFRLNPSLIFNKKSLIFPEVPFGVFFVVGSHFHGFHIRFRDIARGGIRIVKSFNEASYELNMKSMLEENYNLAFTQQKKNKDIPESGSKGVILMKYGFISDEAIKNAFEKYADSIIDILDFQSPKYVDLYGKREILFFGPDENTAGFCDFATLYAKSRGCSWWKSFLTGKSQSLGGIPHDEYGMTSLSVRAFIEGVYEKLGLTETPLMKFQTGGPRGDLGSNEILLSTDNETYVGMVDGSGTLVDPQGLNREELVRLAKLRVPVENFNTSLLSKDGFFVSVKDMNVKLPNGIVVSDGTVFRNKIHSEYLFQFLPKVDVFVPCGGRPASININNIDLFLDSKTGKSKIKIIAEGANLFITQDCRLKLEQAGCVLIKDSSANKGGVTSSSMEVLASLALNDSDFVNKFIKNVDGVYDSYVKFIQAKVCANATAEFDQLWALNQSTGKPISILSDELSVAINKLNDDLIDCKELFAHDLKFKEHLLIDKIIPQVLFETSSQTKEEVVANIPENYVNAMLSVYLASNYVYKYGAEPNMGKFLAFISELKN